MCLLDHWSKIHAWIIFALTLFCFRRFMIWCWAGDRFQSELILQVEAVKSHALKVLFLHLESLLIADLVCHYFKLCVDRSMIWESYVQDASHSLKLNILGVLLPEYPITPGRHSLLLTCVVLAGTLIVLVRWWEGDVALCEISIELILQLIRVLESFDWLNELIRILKYLPVLLVHCWPYYFVWETYAIVQVSKYED